jgi:hypothetical protein
MEENLQGENVTNLGSSYSGPSEKERNIRQMEKVCISATPLHH